MIKKSFLALAALVLLPVSQAFALSVSYDLNCILNTVTCSSTSYGTVTLEDLDGADAGKVKITVDLGFADTQKFMDLMLNYAGTAITITDDDAGNTVLLSSNGFSIAPYGGLFDVGGTGGQGWSSTTSGPYVAVLSGNVPLSVLDFNVLDSLNNFYVALHIQAIGGPNGEDCDGSGEKAICVPGMPGEGSIKVGGSEIPEPATMALLSLGLGGAALSRRRRKNQAK